MNINNLLKHVDVFLENVPLENIFRQLGIDPHSVHPSNPGGFPHPGNLGVLSFIVTINFRTLSSLST